ncbi:Zn-ribbon-containing, possible RNA-binding protein-like protein [Legionella busanensis]|uniref:Zn-ribbon-containing, possible RNA-binding protein-like protein n=1 Tax=Legionella busanensis TaxID=190655 RepID=A0A378JQZ3_9GAMM|nr:DUF721 domain-containing protein [Legionella busanensis]STX52673.1 Zn-ribbon-containing, possible RNA-binding protein-like protein [Legionella busanensis]
MRPINRCLNKQLADICQQVIQLDKLNSLLKPLLPSHLKEFCHVGSFNKGSLLISLTNTAWATELRYYLPTLRDKLRKEAGLYQLMNIRIQIITVDNNKENNRLVQEQQLSLKARSLIREVGNLCAYKPLKQALLHLAE